MSTSGQAFVDARDFLLRHRVNYDVAMRDFRWPALDQFNWALDYFDPMARANPATALHVVDEDGTENVRSFAEMVVASNRVANFLRAAGVQRGDAMLLMLGNEVAFWDTLLACIKLGAIVSPAAGLLTPADLEDRITRGHIRHVVASAAQCHKFQRRGDAVTRVCVGTAPEGWRSLSDAQSASETFAADGPTRADDPLLLYFTSGTTAQPKMVLQTHQSYPVGHLSTMFFAGVQPGDRHWNISSPGWAKHAWSCVFAPWNAGATVFVYNYARFDARAVLQALVTHGVTTLCAPPTVWRMLVQEPLDRYPVVLRELLSAGEPLNPEVIEKVRTAWGLTIRDGYGQTETTCLVGNSPGQPIKPGSMGRPLIGCPIVLVDANGHVGDEGEVCLDLSHRPLNLTSGYAHDDARTSEVMRDGYYHTGDLAMRDADGYITFVGRTDDVFKASDYRISPFELESALLEHPAIAEAAVVPSPDPTRHAVPKAFVTLAAGHEPSADLARDIFAFARQTLAPYKRVRRLEFAALPKTISGKIRRVELRTLEQQRRTSGTRAPLEFFEEDFS